MASQKQVGAPAPMTPEDAYVDVLIGQIRQRRACLEMAMRRGGIFCARPAEYDLRTRSGMWGWLCREHAGAEGIGLGTGFGQRAP